MLFEFFLGIAFGQLSKMVNEEKVRRTIFDSLHQCADNLITDSQELFSVKAILSQKTIATRITSARSREDIEAVFDEISLQKSSFNEVREELSLCVLKTILENVPNMNRAIHEEIMSLISRVDEGFSENRVLHGTSHAILKDIHTLLEERDSFAKTLQDNPLAAILELQQKYLLEQGVGEIHTNLETGEQVFFLKPPSGFTLSSKNDEAFRQFFGDLKKGNAAELDLTRDANVEFSENIKSLFKNVDPQYLKVVPSPVTNTVNLRYEIGSFSKVLSTLISHNRASDCYV